MTNRASTATRGRRRKLPGAAAFGRTNVLYGLVNGYGDFGSGPFKPSIGAGIGAANVDFDNQGVNAVGTAMNTARQGSPGRSALALPMR